MKMIQKIKITLIFFFITKSMLTQVLVGEWRDYLPYGDLKKVVETKNYIYAASKFSLIEYNKTDNSISRLSKINGLNGNDIESLSYNQSTNTVIVGYYDGDIDFIKNGYIENFIDIKDANIIYNKKINDVYFEGTDAYIACGFGIVKLDMLTRLIVDVVYLGVNGTYEDVYHITSNNKKFYAYTKSGLKYIEKDVDFFNIYNWNTDYTFPSTQHVTQLYSWNNSILVNVNPDVFRGDTLYILKADKWEIVTQLQGKDNNSLNIKGDSIVIAHNYNFNVYDTNWNELMNVYQYGTNKPAMPQSVIFSIYTDDFWIADNFFGVIKNRDIWKNEVLYLTSPYYITADNITFYNNSVWIAGGGLFSDKGFYHKNKNEKWINYNSNTKNYMNGFKQVSMVIPDPINADRLFIASNLNGLMEVQNDTIVKRYTSQNSPLIEKYIGAIDIPYITFDNYKNLWITNNLAKKIFVLTQKNNWITFDLSNYISGDVLLYSKIIIDQNGYKWIAIKGKGIIVLDDNGTLDNKTDDRIRLLSDIEGKGALPSLLVYSIVEDKNQTIWVGTDQGVVVFYNTFNIFDLEYNIDAQRIYVEVSGNTQYLLETEQVNDIVVDDANQKWFATQKNGVFLMNSYGTNEIFHFTEENSPLLNNQVNKLGYDAKNGEVIFATKDGLIAYRSSVTRTDPNYSNVYAFPNPVKSSYKGWITIRGLADNSFVKITDLSGELVFETKSSGGSAIWDGNNLDKIRVQSGVYLVFATDELAKETTVTKILFIR